MKINISYPATGQQKVIEIEDEKKLRALYDKRISHEVTGEALSDGFAGYVFKISGGNDKQGFPMKQGVLTQSRVRLLLRAGTSCYRPRRDGERKRKSVRGCIVSADLSIVNLVIVKKGEQEIPGLTDAPRPLRLGPKRASKIRKLFNLRRDIKRKPEDLATPKDHKYIFGDDVKKYVIRRNITPADGGKPYTKAPKVQRLVTPLRLKRKRDWCHEQQRRGIKSKQEAKEYHKLFQQRLAEKKEHHKQILEKKKIQKQ